MIRTTKFLAPAVTLAGCLSLSACRSAFVQTSIVNHTGAQVRLIEVDYPSASFGTQQIADNGAYHSHFKILDSGPVKISFTAGDNRVHSATGPTLTEGEQGSLTITLEEGGKIDWTTNLSAAR